MSLIPSRRQVSVLALLSAAGLLFAACGTTAPTQSSAPKKPLTLVLYSAQGYDQAEAQAFQKATGIKVELDDMSTGPLLAKVAAEGNHPKWDVIWFDGNGAMASLDQQGALLTGWLPANASYYNSLGKQMLPSDDAYFPTGVTAAAAIAYNTKLVSASQVPTTWSQVLNFKSGVGMNNPAVSGPTYPYVASILNEMGTTAGQNFFLNLKKNGLQIFSTNGDTLQALQTGALKIATVQDSAILSAIQSGAPIGISYPTDGVAMLPSDMAISKNAPDLKAAEEFVNFVLSAKGQQVQSTQGGGDSLYQPVVTDVTANPGRTVPVPKWVVVDPVWAGQHENSIIQWFTQNIVQ